MPPVAPHSRPQDRQNPILEFFRFETRGVFSAVVAVGSECANELFGKSVKELERAAVFFGSIKIDGHTLIGESGR
jgi:hypothetical protein